MGEKSAANVLTAIAKSRVTRWRTDLRLASATSAKARRATWQVFWQLEAVLPRMIGAAAGAGCRPSWRKAGAIFCRTHTLEVIADCVPRECVTKSQHPRQPFGCLAARLCADRALPG